MGSFLRGCKVEVLMAVGITGDGRRLSEWSFSCWSRELLAMEMSALESMSAATVASPFSEDMWMAMVGASSICVEVVWYVHG